MNDFTIKFADFETAMRYMQAGSKTSDPVEILAAAEEPEDDTDAREEQQGNDNQLEQFHMSNTQTGRFFSFVSKTSDTWFPALKAIGGASLYNAINALYLKHKFAEITGNTEGSPFGDVLKDAIPKDLHERNTADEAERTNEDGETTEELIRKAQGISPEERQQQIALNVEVYVTAVRELAAAKAGEFWYPSAAVFAELVKQNLSSNNQAREDQAHMAVVKAHALPGEVDGQRGIDHGNSLSAAQANLNKCAARCHWQSREIDLHQHFIRLHHGSAHAHIKFFQWYRALTGSRAQHHLSGHCYQGGDGVVGW